MTFRTGSAAAASCLKRPMAGRTTAVPPKGYVSHTRPRLISSQDSHVFHGVLPPAQLLSVPDRMRPAPMTPPLELNDTIDAPPPEAALVSELETYTQPLPFGITAPPSGALCQTYEVPGTACPDRAITWLVKPAGNRMPLASAACSGPYGPGAFWAGAAYAADQAVNGRARPLAPAIVARSKVRRSIDSPRLTRWTVAIRCRREANGA